MSNPITVADVEALADTVIQAIPGIPPLLVPIATKLLNLAIPFLIAEIESIFTKQIAKIAMPVVAPATSTVGTVAATVLRDAAGAVIG